MILIARSQATIMGPARRVCRDRMKGNTARVVDDMSVRIKKIEGVKAHGAVVGTANTYLVVDGEREFIITCTFHPHHGTKLTLAEKEGTLHIESESNTVVRQMVALGGGCALAIREEVVEGLSPSALRTLIEAEWSG